MYKLMMKYVSITKEERTTCAWVWAYHSNGDSNIMYPISYTPIQLTHLNRGLKYRL